MISEEERVTLIEIGPADTRSQSPDLIRYALWHWRCAVAADPLLVFTPRELAVGELLTRGRSSGIIARVLGMDESTVKGKITRMKRKAGTDRRAGIVLYIRRAQEARGRLKIAA